MARSRNRAVRRRQARRTTSSLSSEDVKTAAERLLHLPVQPGHLTLHTHLRTLVNNDENDAQELVGSAIASLLQTEAPPPIHRARLAELAERLSEWQTSSTEQAITVFTHLAILTVQTNDVRDTAALAACMRGITYMANTSSKHTREILQRKIPSLIEPLHAGLFCPRVMYPTNSYSDGSLSASMGSASNSDTNPPASRANVQLAGVRICAIDALVALSAISSRALVPFWSLFLPERDGVPARTSGARENLASMILFERRTELRSKAVTATTSLIVTSSRFLQTVTPHRTADKSQSFTSTSSRVLRTCVALHTVVASALRKETSPIVLAKLAKLASELASNTQIPAVPVKKVDALLRELLSRVVDAQSTDLTTRSAAASAMAVVLGKNAQYLDPVMLERMCATLVVTLNSDGSHPSAEILTVFVAVVQNYPRFFLMLWRGVKIPDPVSCQDEASSMYCLHFARLVEAFLREAFVCIEGSSEADAFVDFELDDMLVELYDGFLKYAVNQKHSTLQISVIIALDYGLKLTNLRNLPANETDTLVGDRNDTHIIHDTIETLKYVGASNAPLSVRLVAVRALASIPLSNISSGQIIDVMEYFNVLTQNNDTELHIRSKCMMSSAALLGRIEKCRLMAKEYVNIGNESFSTAISFLTSSDPAEGDAVMPIQSTEIATARTAVCTFISSFICLLIGNMDREWEESGFGSNRMKGLEELLRICESGGEHINTRCSACKLLGDIVEFDQESHGNLSDEECERIVVCLKIGLDVKEAERLQLAAMRSLKRVIGIDMDDEFMICVMFLAARCYVSAKSNCGKTDGTSKARHQSCVLREESCEVVFTVLSNLEEEKLRVHRDIWVSQCDGNFAVSTIMECVLQHLSLPQYVAEYLRGRESGEESDTCNGRMLFESLSQEYQQVVMKAESFVEEVITS